MKLKFVLFPERSQDYIDEIYKVLSPDLSSKLIKAFRKSMSGPLSSREAIVKQTLFPLMKTMFTK